jgi:ABC-type branched-subunit amino acid transport system substrate-binding protein
MRLYIIFPALLLAGCSRPDSNTPIELGHLHAADPGDAEVRAVTLAVEDLNRDAAARPLGRPIKVLHASAGSKPEEAGAQAARLIALNKVVGLIGGERFDQAERIGAAVQGESVLAVSPADWAGTAPSPNLFTVGVAPAERGRVLAKSVLERKVQVVAIVRDPAARSANLAADQFAAECQAAGVRVIDGSRDPGNQFADAIFFACPVKQALETRPAGDVRPVVFGGGDGELPTLLAGGPPADGFLVATAAHPELKSDRWTAFTTRYREKHGQPPPTAAILAHDAFSVWIEAVRRANTLELGPVRDQLRNRDRPFDTLTGPLTFADDHTARRPVFVGTVAGGKLADIRAFDATPPQ